MVHTVSITENRIFLRLYKKGKFYVGKFMVLYVAPNRSATDRLGITASKKVGKSNRRNRIRRLIKENYRLYEEFVKPGFDLVFVARENETLPDFHEVRKEMKYLMKKLEVFDGEKWDCRKNS